MARLLYKNKVILKDMKIAKNVFTLSKGLMFSGKKKVNNGLCLVFPGEKNKKYSCTITMLFCFFSYQIIFIDKDFKVIDKVTLKPFKFSYVPKKHCKYIIESLPGKFDNVKINDNINIDFC